jgi:hypothetical protein
MRVTRPGASHLIRRDATMDRRPCYWAPGPPAGVGGW